MTNSEFSGSRVKSTFFENMSQNGQKTGIVDFEKCEKGAVKFDDLVEILAVSGDVLVETRQVVDFLQKLPFHVHTFDAQPSAFADNMIRNEDNMIRNEPVISGKPNYQNNELVIALVVLRIQSES